MSNGFCPYVLYNIAQVAEGNAPGRKIQIAGMLQMLMCCQNSSASILNDAYQDGHIRPVQVKYRTRPLVSVVQDEDDCDVNALPAYSELTIPSLSHKQVTFFIPDATVYQYCIDASNTRSMGQPPTQVMNEVYDTFVEYANVLMKAMNQSVVTYMASRFGLNKSSNSSLTYININQNADTINLSNGIVQLMRDMQENEVCDNVCLVGGGIWSGYNMSLAAQCCNAAGMDLSRLAVPTFFFDKDSQTIWGTDQVGVFAPGSVKLLSRLKYEKAAFSGYKGSSFFTTVQFPAQDFANCNNECLNDLRFDVQMKYVDCPTTITVNGVNTSVERGWIVILSKEFALYVQPTTLYNAADSLSGTNGTWKYKITNTTYSGNAYGSYAGY